MMQTIAVYLFVGQSVLGLSIAPCQEVVEPSQTALLSSFDTDSKEGRAPKSERLLFVR